MQLSTLFVKTFYGSRLSAIEKMQKYPLEVQEEQFAGLINYGSAAEYLASYGITALSSYADFAARVPVVTYEDLAPWIERVVAGEHSLLISDPTRWLAKSSGTTNDTSKYIPINRYSLDNCHFRGGRDVLALFARNFPNSKGLSGSPLTLGGTQKMVSKNSALKAGDLSAILIDNSPTMISLVREPQKEVALIADFSEKIEAICRTCSSKNITSFAGVPSWNLVLMNKILEYNNKSSLLDVWPDLSLFIHGGISFEPYRAQYQKIIPSSDMVYMETYNASEGFFAIQDDPSDSSLLLMLDYGNFYEFLPIGELANPAAAVPLEGVKCGVNYAMIISTAGGLWRYMIGDTVEFTSIKPYKLKITGRTKHFINAFGEELIIDNAQRALAVACRDTGAVVSDYTVAPMFMNGKSKGAHQWVVEFGLKPKSVEQFTEILDKQLQECNSDYAAKRSGDATMRRLELTEVQAGTFNNWMMSRGKLGGQNKVPRLSGSRDYVEAILKIVRN